MAVPRDIIAGTNGKDIASSWTQRFNSQGLEVGTPGDYACLSLNIFTTSLVGRQTSGMPHRYFTTVSYTGDGSDQPDHKTATKIIELLRGHKQRGKPFFLAAGFIRPHYPMVAPKQYFAPYPWQKMQMPQQFPNDLDDIPKLGRTSMSSQNGLGNYPDNQKRMWTAYFAAVTFMDEQVGRILNELDRLGLRDTTAVVFISDHGYHLGDHTFWKKDNLHEQVTRVPLIISVPGFPTGRTQSIVELVDVFPTVTELVGVPRPTGLQGTSLVPVLRNPSVTVKQGALSIARGYSWRVADWAYMRYKDNTEANERWVADGNFTAHVQDLVWSAADLVVWLDLPRWVVMPALVRRTLARMLLRKELWNGNRERWSNLFRTNPEDNILLWGWTRHAVYRERIPASMGDPRWRDLTFVRLRSRREVRRCLRAAAQRRGVT